jgi:hypothetical protein
MQINTQEINGYLIENFNQYDLEEGKAQGICPLCSFDRKLLIGRLVIKKQNALHMIGKQV